MTAAERTRETYAEYVRLGICTKCHTRKATPGKRTCTECREWFRAYNERRRRELPALGRCVQCGQPHRGACVRCERCSRSHVADSVRCSRYRAQSGQCPDCGAPVSPGGYRCTECSDAHQQREQRRLERLRVLRKTCGCERWRVRLHYDEEHIEIHGDRVLVRVVLHFRCPTCDRKRKETVWAQAERLLYLMGAGPALEE